MTRCSNYSFQSSIDSLDTSTEISALVLFLQHSVEDAARSNVFLKNILVRTQSKEKIADLD